MGLEGKTNYKTAEDINGLVNKALEQKEWIVFLIHGLIIKPIHLLIPLNWKFI